MHYGVCGVEGGGGLSTCMRCLKNVTARTELPTESRGGEYTAMPITLGITMYTRPATPARSMYNKHSSDLDPERNNTNQRTMTQMWTSRRT